MRSSQSNPTTNLYGSVQLAVKPNDGYEFDSWSDRSDFITISDWYDPNARLGMSTPFLTDGSIKANFRKLPTYPVTVTDDGHGSASASVIEGYRNQQVTLSATPSDGYEFDHWEVVSPDGLAIADDAFSMPESAVEVRAVFREAASGTAGGSAEVTDSSVAADADATTDTAAANGLPATGDAVGPIAVGVITVSAIAVFLILRRRP